MNGPVAGIQAILNRKKEPHRKRGFFFWALSPWLVLFIVVMGFVIDKSDPGPLALLIAIELLAILMLLGLWDGYRFWWAWRGVGALVFLGYLAYVVSMLIEEWGAFKVPKHRGESAFVNALVGFVVFGLPGLWYAVFARLTLREEEKQKGPSDSSVCDPSAERNADEGMR